MGPTRPSYLLPGGETRLAWARSNNHSLSSVQPAALFAEDRPRVSDQHQGSHECSRRQASRRSKHPEDIPSITLASPLYESWKLPSKLQNAWGFQTASGNWELEVFFRDTPRPATPEFQARTQTRLPSTSIRYLPLSISSKSHDVSPALGVFRYDGSRHHHLSPPPSTSPP